MSISIILLPMAVAGVAAVTGLAARRDDATVVQVQTRMRDEALLRAALAQTGAVTEPVAGGLVARWEGVTARFERGADGVWSAHFTGAADRDRAVEIVQAVDAAYGRQVQQAVLARLRDRAPAAGLRLESESVLADDAVRLVFAVEREVG
jgi:hypothetical protein